MSGERLGARNLAPTRDVTGGRYWWLAMEFHQAGCRDVAQACLNKAAFLAGNFGDPFIIPTGNDA
jgi:hypothetical protein